MTSFIRNKNSGLLNSKPLEDLTKLRFGVGPLLVDGNHWNAFLVDLGSDELSLLDPFGNNDARSQDIMSSWQTYWNNNRSEPNDWTIKRVDHPIQQDGFSCGVFVCLFIEHFVPEQTIIFDSSFQALEQARNRIESAI